jgi:branched-chain amino acid transport system substrate-binding protein
VSAKTRTWSVAIVVVVSAVVAVLAARAVSGHGAANIDHTRRVVVGVDLPFQGVSATAANEAYNAMQLYLEQVRATAGEFTVSLKRYDDSTSAADGWDQKTCVENAIAHIQTPNEVAVIGPHDAGCAKSEAEILNAAPGGPMLMVSHAVSDPGLTKPWGYGEPAAYVPTGKLGFARVVPTDEDQGTAAARFAAKDLAAARCLVLSDGEPYGAGLAKAFTLEAKALHIEVVSEQVWDKVMPSYTGLFTAVAAKGVDCVYLAGVAENNAAQVLSDKVTVLGDNTAVPVIVPEAFADQQSFAQLSAARGAYVTGVGLWPDAERGASMRTAVFLDAYTKRFKAEPTTMYAAYGVVALQVVLAAIEYSDGTRAGVRNAVLSGAGVTVPAQQCMLGKSIHVDPTTGDVNAHDISVGRVDEDGLTFVSAQSLS